MADLNAILLKDVEIRWAFLSEPQTRGEYASNKYQVDVLMTKEQAQQVKKLKNPRQNIKEVDGKYSITLKSSRQPSVVGKDKVAFTEDELKTIGNGTKAIVKATQYKGYKDQIFLGLKAIMITDLKKYTGADDFADVEAEVDGSSAPFDAADDDLI